MIEASNEKVIEADNQDRDDTGITGAITRARSGWSRDVLAPTNPYQV